MPPSLDNPRAFDRHLYPGGRGFEPEVPSLSRGLQVLYLKIQRCFRQVVHFAKQMAQKKRSITSRCSSFPNVYKVTIAEFPFCKKEKKTERAICTQFWSSGGGNNLNKQIFKMSKLKCAGVGGSWSFEVTNALVWLSPSPLSSVVIS